MVETVFLASIRGPCAGVDRALRAAEDALLRYDKVYVIHDPVHNRHVSNSLRARGLRFANDINEVPDRSVIVLSAHGTAKDVIQVAHRKQLTIIDACCPLVTKVHNAVVRYEADGRMIVIIGDFWHQEIVGAKGQLVDPSRAFVIKSVDDVEALPIDNNERVAYITQTTLNIFELQPVIDALQAKFSDITGPGMRDVCFATKNRQEAVLRLCKAVDVIIVIGSQHSSNSKNLCKIALQQGLPSYLIDDIDDLPKKETVLAYKNLGITAGASAPEALVTRFIDQVRKFYPDVVIKEMEGEKESVVFAMPKVQQPS